MIRFIRRLFACRHRVTYRERRPLSGAPDLMIWHWVCDNCGVAWPCLDRTLEEHRQAAKSVVRLPRAIKRTRVDVFARSAFRMAIEISHRVDVDPFVDALEVLRIGPRS